MPSLRTSRGRAGRVTPRSLQPDLAPGRGPQDLRAAIARGGKREAAGTWPADRVAVLEDFARRAIEAAEPAEILEALCAACRHGLGLEGAEAYPLRDGWRPGDLARLRAELADGHGGAARARLEEVIAGQRRSLIVRAEPGVDDEAAPGDGNPDTDPGRTTTAVLPIGTGRPPLALLALRSRLRPIEWPREILPFLTPFLEHAGLALQSLLDRGCAGRDVDRLCGVLKEVSRALVTHADLESLLDAVAEIAVRATGFDASFVFLYDAAADRLEAGAARGLAAAGAEALRAFAPRERLPGRAAVERRTTFAVAIGRDPRPEAAIERAMGLDTLISAPMIVNETLLGVLSLATMQPGAATREAVEIVQALANQLAVAIANARLRDAMRMRLEERDRTDRELRLLYDISRAVVGTLALEDRLRVVAEGLTQATGTTHCALFRMERNELLPWMSVGGTAESARRFLSLDLSPVEGARLLRLLKRRKTHVIAEDSPRDPFAGSAWKEELGIRSALWLPLVFQNRITGVALLYCPEEHRTFSTEQLRLARAVSNQAAVAVRLSQAYEHERNIAVTLQRGLGPTVATQLKDFDIAHGYHPALQEAHVGGDIYDAFPLPDGRVALVMADVAGKGLSAAVQTTLLRNMLRAYAFENPAPGSVLTRLNRALYYYTEPGLFITGFYGVLCPRTGSLTYSNAGHDCPLLYSASEGFCTTLDTTGIALGMDGHSVYAARRVSLEPRDILLLYTDGVTQARSGSLFFGRTRLEELLAQVANSKPNRIVTSIYRAVRTFSQGELHDDIALLVVKAKPHGISNSRGDKRR